MSETLHERDAWYPEPMINPFWQWIVPFQNQKRMVSPMTGNIMHILNSNLTELNWAVLV